MSHPELEECLTNHAMLVLWGQFAQQIGLIEAVEAISMHQKTCIHRPQTKALEFLVAILAGLSHLKDISRSAHPLDQDQAVARAWGQPAWADYSGVSRTLQAMSMVEAQAIVQALEHISQPFIDQEVSQVYLTTGGLTWDFDLTGRPVSNTSVTYPDAAFGHMSDGVQLGYQAAMVSMHSPTYGRLWLSSTPHPGDTVSCTQAEALVYAAEARTGVHPRRRTELLRQRLKTAIGQAQSALEVFKKAQQALEQAEVSYGYLQKLEGICQQSDNWQEILSRLEAEYQARQRPERPHSKLAQARQRLAVQERRKIRQERALQKAKRRLERKAAQFQCLQEHKITLEQRLRRFEQENEANQSPVRVTIRIDAGFGTPENVGLLIEMGYTVYTKPQSHWVTTVLKREAADRQDWQRVGANAEMVSWSGKMLSRYPYPLDVALERFHIGEQLRHSALLHYGDPTVSADLPSWFQYYNARQTIEAGIKEGKGIFKMHHLKVRSQAGLFLQEHFAAFAANFVRWAAHWLTTQCPQLPGDDQPKLLLPAVKEIVQVAAHTSAWVIWQPDGCLLKFTDHSIFAGKSLQAKGSWTFQLPLPWLKNCVFEPT